jgi:uncharacterized membrane protein YkoI
MNKSMNTKMILSSMLACGLLAFGLIACATDKEEGHEAKANAAKLEAQAKVKKADAERTALAKVPGGAIKEGELEKEGGRLVWSFDISTAGTKDITEVQVNAMTGDVVSVEKEAPEDQAWEKAADARKDGHDNKD